MHLCWNQLAPIYRSFFFPEAFHGVTPNCDAIGAIFLFAESYGAVRCGAVRCGAVKKGKKSHRTVAKHLIYPKGLTAVVFL